MFLELLASILPEGILDNFKVTDVKKGAQFLEIHLEEKYLLEGFEEGVKVHSKGFHKDIVIKDFPIRDRCVLLHVRRRRWENAQTGEEIKRNLGLVAEGTRMTKEFAAFLKGIS